MNFDKLMNSRINWIADWIIRIVVINVLVILCSIPVVTLYPAFLAGYSVFADLLDKKEVRIIPSFFHHIRRNLVRRSLFGIAIMGITYLSLTNAMYYNDLITTEGGWFYLSGYYVTLVLLAMLYALMLYTVVVFHELPSIRIKHLVKLSLYLAGKYYFVTVLLVFLNLIPLFMFFSSVTSVLFVFSGISIPLLLHAYLTRPARQYIQSVGEPQ